MSNDNIGAKLRALRARRGISQAKLAAALNNISLRRLRGKIGDVRTIDAKQIWDWESGNRQPDRLMRLAIDRIKSDHS